MNLPRILPLRALSLALCAPILALSPISAHALPFDAVADAPLLVPVLPFLDMVAVGADPLLGAAALPQALAQARGRNGVTADAALDAVVSGNSATHVNTGSNTISDGSFANMSGLPVVIQNTGANVLIQNATVINLQVR